MHASSHAEPREWGLGRRGSGKSTEGGGKGKWNLALGKVGADKPVIFTKTTSHSSRPDERAMLQWEDCSVPKS